MDYLGSEWLGLEKGQWHWSLMVSSMACLLAGFSVAPYSRLLWQYDLQDLFGTSFTMPFLTQPGFELGNGRDRCNLMVSVLWAYNVSHMGPMGETGVLKGHGPRKMQVV